MIRMRPGECGMRFACIFLPTACRRPSRRWRARTSGSFGAEWHVPSVFWFVGGVDRDVYAKAKRDGTIGALPTNHSPFFAPVIHPTVETGVETLVVTALAWLAKSA